MGHQDKAVTKAISAGVPIWSSGAAHHVQAQGIIAARATTVRAGGAVKAPLGTAGKHTAALGEPSQHQGPVSSPQGVSQDTLWLWPRIFFIAQ